jgi:hypothetical protein
MLFIGWCLGIMDPTNVGFLKWLDPYEKKEKGSHKEENERFRKALQNSISKGDLDKLKEKYKIYSDEGQQDLILEYKKVLFKFESKWKFANGNWHETDGMDISKDGEIVAYTYPSTHRNENYRLAVKGRVQWTHKAFGGPFVAILGSRIFFIEGDKLLHYTRLVSMNLEGGDRKVIYEEESRLLELVMCESRTLFLLASDAGVQSLFHVTEGGLDQLSPKGVSFYPIGGGRSPIYFVRERDFSAPWKLVGAAWKLNSRIRVDGIEFCSAAAKILITKFYGVRTIWKMDGGRAEPLRIYSGVFEILPNTKFMGWLGVTDKLYCIRPGASVYTINLKTMSVSPTVTYGGTLRTGISVSSDRLPVRWAVLGPERPTGLVCISYGSYGLPTSLKTTRWRAWIDAGWAIAFLFIRGGGDGNEMWADLGRLGGKKTEFDDVEACVKDLQRLTRCKPANTVLFGRSAGGLIIGNLAARWPRGELAGIIYAEVPYVDLLKTAANPQAPLTPYEYKEFGNPRAGLIDFEAALEISPIHQLGTKGAPGIKVLCRTGTADIQVFPYESLKWITALRGGKKDDTKLLYIDNEGHRSNKTETEYAEDFAIINSWCPV